MQKVLALFIVPALCLPTPQEFEGFGDASDQEISQILDGTYEETFDDAAPEYSYNYKVADDDEQTYIAMNEERAGETVNGQYSYVDPLGSLIVVNYSAGPEGYTETREVQRDFVSIRARPARTQTINAVQSGGGQRLNAQRLEAQRLAAARAEAQAASQAEAARLAAERREAQRRAEAQAQRVALAEAETARREAQRAEAARREAQRAEAARLQSQRAEAARLQAQRAQAASAANSQANIVAQIVSQIQPLVSQSVNSAVNGQRQTQSTSSLGNNRFSVRPTPVTRPIITFPNPTLIPLSVPAPTPSLRLAPLPSPSPVLAVPSSRQPSASSVSNLFGQEGTINVRINTPDFNIEY